MPATTGVKAKKTEKCNFVAQRTLYSKAGYDPRQTDNGGHL